MSQPRADHDARAERAEHDVVAHALRGLLKGDYDG